MKTTEWFACFSFGKHDILIPRSTILECRFGGRSGSDASENPGLPAVASLDDILNRAFGIGVPEGSECLLIMKGGRGYTVSTRAVPAAEEIPLIEFRPVSGITASLLLKSGIIAFRFLKDRIQYAVDMEKLVEKAGAGK